LPITKKHSYKETIPEEKLQRYENYSKFQTQEHGSIITGKRQEAFPEYTGQEECTNYQQNGRTNISIWENKQTPNVIFRNPDENLGKELTGAEFIPGNSSEEETTGTEESDEDIGLRNTLFQKKLKQQL
jgi:hypothetical protein